MTDINPYRAPAASIPSDAEPALLDQDAARRVRAQGLARETTLRALAFAKLFTVLLYALMLSAAHNLAGITFGLLLAELVIAVGLNKLDRWAAAAQVLISVLLFALALRVIGEAWTDRDAVAPGMLLAMIQIGLIYLMISAPSRFVFRAAYRAAVTATPDVSTALPIAVKAIMFSIALALQVAALWLAAAALGVIAP